MSYSTHQPAISTSALTFQTPEGRVILDTDEQLIGAGRYAIVGDNGSGKTTWLNLLAGTLTPTTGSVTRHGTVGRLPQNLLAHPLSTVAETLGIARQYAALSAIWAGSVGEADYDAVGADWDIAAKAQACMEAQGLSFGLDRQIGTLSGGELARLHFASFLLTRPDILLLDEPSNNLDAEAQSSLIRLITEWSGPLVVASHDPALLAHVDHIGQLSDGNITWYHGNWEAYCDALAAERDKALSRLTNAKAEVRRQQRQLRDAATRQQRRDRAGRKAASGMPKIVAGRMKRRAEKTAARDTAIHHDRLSSARDVLDAAKDAAPVHDEISLDLPDSLVPARKRVLSAHELRTAHAPAVLELELRGPERVVITGRNGIGKTSLLRAIGGLDAPAGGAVTTFVPHFYVPQDLRNVDDELTVMENVQQLSGMTRRHDIHEQLARLNLAGDVLARPAGELSGGQRWRLVLASVALCEPAPQLLLLDEPTNNLDLASRAQLVAALLSYRGAILAASHDEPFIDAVGLTRLRLDA